jgi:hypothetical protein
VARPINQRIDALGYRELPGGERCDRAIVGRFRALRHLEAVAHKAGDDGEAGRAASLADLYAWLLDVQIVEPEPAVLVIVM